MTFVDEGDAERTAARGRRIPFLHRVTRTGQTGAYDNVRAQVSGVLTSLCVSLHRLVRSECHIHKEGSSVLSLKGPLPSSTNQLAPELLYMTTPNTQLAKLT